MTYPALSNNVVHQRDLPVILQRGAFKTGSSLSLKARISLVLVCRNLT
jgi:hypothetical protein